jgi:predicted nucleic acid-binding protein
VNISDALRDVTRIFLDTAPVIHVVEQHPRYAATLATVFDQLDAGELFAVTSPVTLAECLIVPLRLGPASLQQLFSEVVTAGAGTVFVPIDDNVAHTAADLRARHNLALLDALQAAIALASGCDALLTNDIIFQRVPGLNVLLVDDLLD